MSEDLNIYDDSSREFYRNLNTCPCCGKAIYTHEEIAKMAGVSRRTFYRWLAGSNSARAHNKIVLWLVNNTAAFRDRQVAQPGG
jgi:hypothetical protein